MISFDYCQNGFHSSAGFQSPHHKTIWKPLLCVSFFFKEMRSQFCWGHHNFTRLPVWDSRWCVETVSLSSWISTLSSKCTFLMKCLHDSCQRFQGMATVISKYVSVLFIWLESTTHIFFFYIYIKGNLRAVCIIGDISANVSPPPLTSKSLTVP